MHVRTGLSYTIQILTFTSGLFSAVYLLNNKSSGTDGVLLFGVTGHKQPHCTLPLNSVGHMATERLSVLSISMNKGWC